MFAELNGGGIDWGIDSKDFPYKKIQELDQSKKYVVKGMFINRNKSEKELKEYGASVVIVLDGINLSAPNFYETAVQTILDDPAKVEAVKNGKCTIGDFYTYESHGKTCHAFKWLDA
jgi:hypothetical protein